MLIAPLSEPEILSLKPENSSLTVRNIKKIPDTGIKKCLIFFILFWPTQALLQLVKRANNIG